MLRIPPNLKHKIETHDDEHFFAQEFVSLLCNAYIFQKFGGRTEVTLYAGDSRFTIDNLLPGGGLVENKVTSLSGWRAERQLKVYLRYVDENGGSLHYNFFRSPAGSKFVPSYPFALMLAEASMKFDLALHIIDWEWWEELQ